MVNPTLFKTSKSSTPLTTNNAGAPAYALSDKEALANLVCTGMLGGTFYVSAEDQLKEITSRLARVEPDFLARLAVYARKSGYMKDAPSVVLAYLATHHPAAFKKAAPSVLDNGRMVRNLVQILRSGQIGRIPECVRAYPRTSIPRCARAAVRDYFRNSSPTRLLNDSVGNTPSLADVIRMVHPKPDGAEQEALFRFLLGKEVNNSSLPAVARQLVAFRSGDSNEMPGVEHRLLDNGKLTTEQWSRISMTMGHAALRKNLNTLARHGVFESSVMTRQVAAKLADRDFILRSKVMPYELLTAFLNIGSDVPGIIREALQDAMEVATENVPLLKGNWVVMVDVSGSMSSPVSGTRTNPKTGRVEYHTAKTRYVDVASLVASAILRKNPNTLILPFDTRLHNTQINPRDSIMTNSVKLASYLGGGTECHIPMRHLNTHNIKADGVIMISDNEANRGFHDRYSTPLQGEWKKWSAANPESPYIGIDVAGGVTSQVQDKKVFQVSGFSDSVFSLIGTLATQQGSWVSMIEKIDL